MVGWPNLSVLSVFSVISVLSFPHTPSSPERPRHHLGGEALAPALDLEPGAGLGRGRGQVGRADAGAERGAQGAAPHDVHLAALVIHRVAVAREPPAIEPEAHQPAGDAALLLRAQRR